MRVVLADPDPELLLALQSALAPWRLEVVVDATPPADEIEAEARATEQSARFIVWRRGGALVVFDRVRGAAAQRPTVQGPLDAADAAAAALTVKTMMRLPPPPPLEGERPPEVPPGPAAPAPHSLELRAQVGLAGRVARGLTTEISGRARAQLMLRPWAPPLRLGAAVDLGPSSDVQRGSFRGRWSDWTALALASWALSAGAWDLEPELGVGATRSVLDGTQMTSVRHEVATLATLHGGAAVRRRFGRFTIGGALSGDVRLATPTYTRVGTTARIYEVPSTTATFGLVITADFGGPR